MKISPDNSLSNGKLHCDLYKFDVSGSQYVQHTAAAAKKTNTYSMLILGCCSANAGKMQDGNICSVLLTLWTERRTKS